MSLPVNLFVDAHTFDSEFQGSRTFIKEIYNRFPTDDNFKLFFAANNLVESADFFAAESTGFEGCACAQK